MVKMNTLTFCYVNVCGYRYRTEKLCVKLCIQVPSLVCECQLSSIHFGQIFTSFSLLVNVMSTSNLTIRAQMGLTAGVALY